MNVHNDFIYNQEKLKIVPSVSQLGTNQRADTSI